MIFSICLHNFKFVINLLPLGLPVDTQFQCKSICCLVKQNLADLGTDSVAPLELARLGHTDAPLELAQLDGPPRQLVTYSCRATGAGATVLGRRTSVLVGPEWPVLWSYWRD